jgi:hypothetical protein
MCRIVGKILIAENQRMFVVLEAQILNHCPPGQHLGGQSTAGNCDTVDCLAIMCMTEDFCVHFVSEPEATNTDVLGIEIIFDTLMSAFFAETGLFHAAERRFDGCDHAFVDADHAVF